MKCSNCGQEMQSDHLYCERCGMEIRIVPDFEPEIENSIIETLSTVAEAIVMKEKKEEPDGFFCVELDKNFFTVKLIASLAVVLIVAGITLLMYFNYSISYLLSNAKKYAEQGKYEEALNVLERAAAYDSGNPEIIFLQAGYYYQLGETEQAAEILLHFIRTERLSAIDEIAAYKNLIYLYDEAEQYEEINDLLLNCPNEEIVTSYQYYMALNPEYSYEKGSYDEVIYLRLGANTTGTIYYTLDGSTPTTASEVYTAPIPLESGRYQVNAIFVNDYGIQSSVVRNLYEINLAVPDAPEVIPESGKYETLTMIEVVLPAEGEVYYTTDMSNPGIDSLRYTGPVEMPLGRSNFKFVIISKEGVSSEITSRSYEFGMNTDVTVNMAISNVINALIQRNVLLDKEGHMIGESGRYVFRYDSIMKINENYYYILNEYHIAENGNEEKAGRLYAVEVYTGNPNRLTYDEQGQVGLIPLS